jgi:hypothetical protein
MRGRIAIALPALGLLAGCGGAASSSAAQPATTPAATTTTGPPAYSADQLRQALLTQAGPYRPAAPADAGEYGSLRAIQNFNQLQGQVTLDKPQCAGVSQSFASVPEVRTAPAAIMTFARDDGQTLTETLMSVSRAIADRQVEQRVPAGCRTFRAQIGGQWSSHQVTEAAGTRIGDASRTVGVVTTSGGVTVRTWYVVLRSRSYLATVMLHGTAVTRPQAEDFARRAYQAAERVLP